MSDTDSDANFDPSSFIDKGPSKDHLIYCKTKKKNKTRGDQILYGSHRFINKMFTKKFNQPLSDKKERTIINKLEF